MKEAFVTKRFQPKTEAIIDYANTIIAEYEGLGFTLTLRQLYYQFVARDMLENTERNYDRLGSIISKARLAGLVDWAAIEDRTRNLQRNSHWTSPEGIIRAAVSSYAIDKWENQPHRIEVWIEKEALVGVIAGVCERLDIDYFACRGYVSQSEQYEAGKRLQRYAQGGQAPVIIHLGDHDPSGLDMTRDNDDRLDQFSWQAGVDVQRIALNFDQIEQYNPPPNPAKQTDSRYGTYAAEYGEESWELDALEPTVIERLIEEKVLTYRDEALWEEMASREADELKALREVGDRWDEIRDFLNEAEDE